MTKSDRKRTVNQPKARQRESQNKIMKFENVSNTELSAIIDNWVKGERDRCIMKRRLIDRICYEPLAEEFDLSVQNIRRIVYKNEGIIFKHLEEPATVPFIGEIIAEQ